MGELTKIGDSNMLTFFSEIKAKIAIPEVKTFFSFFIFVFYFGDQGKNRFPRGEDFFHLFFIFEIRAITGQTTLTQKWRLFFEVDYYRARV